MLKDLVNQLLGSRIVISSAPGNGASSLALYMANTILSEDRFVVYYNPTADVDRVFVEKYYPRVFEQALWMYAPLSDFLSFFQDASSDIDCLIMDPGDTAMVDKYIVPTIGLARKKNSTFICTSQIRLDPNCGWAPYSTIERLHAFDNSIWITNVSGGHPIYKVKYIDVYKGIASSQNLSARELAYYTEEGNIVEL